MESNPKGSATFYQYTLLHKIGISPIQIRLYLFLPILCIALETWLLSYNSAFFFLLSLPVMMWIQYVVSRSVLLIAGYPVTKRWRFSPKPPWIGYMPDQYISYRLFRKVQLHCFWIGLCAAAMFIVWSPPSFTVSMAFSHLWLLLPRLYTLLRLARYKREGMLKFSPVDVSYYSQ